MRVVVAARHGGPDVLELVERPEPVTGPTDLLVRVRATALNRADMNQRNGTYDLPPGSTDVLGLEISGEVVGCGDEVTGWSLGDRVCGVVPGGGHAELATIPAIIALPVPDGFSWAEAAALPEAFLTAYDNVFVRGRLGTSETLLVHGGASGVGTAAVQLARRHGADVYVTCGDARKMDACLALGATAAVNYRTEDFVERVRDLTDGRGVDVILDHIGGPYLQRNLDALALDGRLSIIGTMGGKLGEVDAARLMSKRAWLTGSRLRPRTVAQKAHLVDAVRRQVWPWLEAGEIRPVIDEVLPWERVVEAHTRMEAGEHIGKIVLSIDQ
jgi:NADPH:quinone reductase